MDQQMASVRGPAKKSACDDWLLSGLAGNRILGTWKSYIKLFIISFIIA